MDAAILVLVVIVSIAFGFVGAHNLAGKGRSPALGFAIGLVLGIIGVVLTVAMAPSHEHQLRTHEQLTREVAGRLSKERKAQEHDQRLVAERMERNLQRARDREGAE